MLLWFFVGLVVVVVSGVLAESPDIVELVFVLLVEIEDEFPSDAFCNAFATFEYR